MEKLRNYLRAIKDGVDFAEFIAKCWLILPKDFPSLIKNYPNLIKSFADEISRLISSDPHMLPITSEDIFNSMGQGLSVFLVDSTFTSPLGYAKLYPWGRERRRRKSGRIRIRQLGYCS